MGRRKIVMLTIAAIDCDAFIVASLPGFNASAVGLVVSALFKMLLQVQGVSPIPNASLAIGILAYTAVVCFKVEAPIAVLLGGGLGAVCFYVRI
jgi:hypothetical protein